jgi:hypothetical protein
VANVFLMEVIRHRRLTDELREIHAEIEVLEAKAQATHKPRGMCEFHLEVRCDRGRGNTVSFQSRVCRGTG